jgi:hypothetical protein
VFEDIWYCKSCADKYMIYMDIHGKAIEDMGD